MYLKKLDIHGFKSFADKVNIAFNQGITGIVGPNGSGKSNVIDSVRWVLGEQSPKTLRGNKMEDIIFNGTTHRKALGLAEVTLTFDNSSNFLPIDYNEVSVTRRLYRSGESEYLINNTNCRLKDIRELMMDTGIGIDGYSLIGQGQIDTILSNKPDDRRRIFEEAAGIVKFKARKLESEKRIDNTNNNLLRIEDIISEIEENLEPLKVQSEKAFEYLNISESLKDLELNIFIRDIEKIKDKLTLETEQFTIVEGQISTYDSEIKRLSSRQGAVGEELAKLNTSLDALISELQELKDKKSKSETEGLVFKQKLENVNGNIDRIKSEIESLISQEDDTTDLLDKYNKEFQSLGEKIKTDESALIEMQIKYNKSVEELKLLEKNREDSKTHMIDILNNISSKKGDSNTITKLKENIYARKTRILSEKEELTLNEINIKENYNRVKSSLDSLREQYNELVLKINKITEDKNRDNDTLAKLMGEFEGIKNKHRDCSSEKKLLDAMEKSYEGYNSSVRKVLQLANEDKSFGKGVHGVVAELMDIPKEYEIAMEVALGYTMQNIVCDHESVAKRLIGYLKKKSFGRATFLPLNRVKNYKDNSVVIKGIDGYYGRGAELISFDSQYNELIEYLLGKTLIVENIDVAVEVSKAVKGYKIVTVDGDVINPGGSMTGGSYKSKISNLFSRKRRILELDDKIKELSVSIDKYYKDIELCKSNILDIDKNINECKKQRELMGQDIAKTEVNLEAISKETSNFSSSITNLLDELNQINEELEGMDSTLVNNDIYIKELENSKEKLENDTRETNDIILQKEKGVQQIYEEISDFRVSIASIKEKHNSIEHDIKRTQNNIDQRRNNILSKEESLKKLEIVREECSENIRICDNDIEMFGKNIKEMSTTLNDKKRVRIDVQSKLRGIEKEIYNLKNTVADLKDSLHKIEVRKTRLELQHENQMNSVWEKYEISYLDAMSFKREIGDIQKAEREIKELSKKIRDLGEVNTSSINEYKRISERYNFLKNQKDDLLEAKASLRAVIDELENTMKKQLEEKIKEIDVYFNDIFIDLFDGGKAKLVIEDKEDILNSNIEIVVQPPGKKLQNLSLLSGGEKALTAIALLFAILKSKPTPFCILDEIEAALDDANIYRFAEFLKEFSVNSQFIVITHRKGTMEIIDYLYGITMQEYGVSKVVSVKLADAIS